MGTQRDCLIVDVNYLKELDIEVISPVDDILIVEAEETYLRMYNLIDNIIMGT